MGTEYIQIFRKLDKVVSIVNIGVEDFQKISNNNLQPSSDLIHLSLIC